MAKAIDRERLRELIGRGLTHKQVAARLGSTPGTISTICCREGIRAVKREPGAPKPHRDTLKRVEKVKAMNARGQTGAQIAERMGLELHQVAHLKHRYGIRRMRPLKAATVRDKLRDAERTET